MSLKQTIICDVCGHPMKETNYNGIHAIGCALPAIRKAIGMLVDEPNADVCPICEKGIESAMLDAIHDIHKRNGE